MSATSRDRRGTPLDRRRRPRHEDNLEIEALTAIDAPVFSHLNTYTAIALEGPGPLSITLSPCPDLRLRFPHGEREPLRFAYLDRAGELVIVDADQAEKGPFVERCRGPLARGAPLILEVHAGDARVGEVRLHDWADQASLDLSPTAGWRIPQNAIELWGGDDPGFGLIHVSLAATSVGRGWHSVGHRAGVYRNRVEVRAGPTRPDQ